MEGKRPPLPIVLTANALLDGNAVYYDGTGWSDALASALVASDEAGAVALEARGFASLAQGDVVEPYLVTVALDAQGRAAPAHYREQIRVSGPTIEFGPEHEQAAGAR